MYYWRIELERENAEEQAYLLIEQDALGVQILSERQLVCFLAQEPTEAFKSALEGAGFNWLGCHKLPISNWTQNCADLLHPVKVKRLQILPVLEGGASKAQEHSDDLIIKIIPGCGFGTGHHATTRMVLELLQSPLVAELQPKSILDLGTGSGILALAAARLYEADLLALDNDQSALDNAQDNLALNGLDNAVKLKLAELKDVAGCFNLIMANLYHTILSELMLSLWSHLSPGGLLIISGYLAEQEEEIKDAYSHDNWIFKRQLAQEGWCAALLEKV